MAGSRGVKKRSHEKLTDSNIQHVIGLLNAKSPITKKEIVQQIAELLLVDYGLVAGLEKSPKADLKILRSAIDDSLEK